MSADLLASHHACDTDHDEDDGSAAAVVCGQIGEVMIVDGSGFVRLREKVIEQVKSRNSDSIAASIPTATAPQGLIRCYTALPCTASFTPYFKASSTLFLQCGVPRSVKHAAEEKQVFPELRGGYKDSPKMN